MARAPPYSNVLTPMGDREFETARSHSAHIHAPVYTHIMKIMIIITSRRESIHFARWQIASEPMFSMRLSAIFAVWHRQFSDCMYCNCVSACSSVSVIASVDRCERCDGVIHILSTRGMCSATRVSISKDDLYVRLCWQPQDYWSDAKLMLSVCSLIYIIRYISI